MMVRSFALIWAVLISCLAGCSESGPSIIGGDALRLSAAAGMIEYLQNENLPALKSANKWQSDYGPGLKLTTEHYDIFTTLLEPLMLRQLPGFMESAYRGYNSQLPKPIETKTRFTIYVFATREQWEDFTKGFAGRQAPMLSKIKAGAYYLNSACVAYNIGRERTFYVLGHEGWHQFNSRHFKFRLPSWLDEGIAMLFEANRYEQGLFYFEPGRNLGRLGALRKTLTTDRMVPLRELIATNPGEVLSTEESEAVAAFYGQSYALVRFLREDGYGKRLGSYHQLLLDGLNGAWPLNEANKKIAADRNIALTVRWNRIVGPELFQHYIGDDFKQLEEEYIRFCRKIVYRVRVR